MFYRFHQLSSLAFIAFYITVGCAIVYAQTPVCGPQPDGSYKLCVPLQQGQAPIENPSKYINSLYLYSISIGGVLALVLLIYSGVQYLLAAGNAAEQGAARSRIWRTVIGLIVLMSAVLILDLIDPRLKELKPLNAPKVEGLEERRIELQRTTEQLHQSIALQLIQRTKNEIAKAGTNPQELDKTWRETSKKLFQNRTDELAKEFPHKTFLTHSAEFVFNPGQKISDIYDAFTGDDKQRFSRIIGSARADAIKSFVYTPEQITALIQYLPSIETRKREGTEINFTINPRVDFLTDLYFAEKHLPPDATKSLTKSDVDDFRLELERDKRFADRSEGQRVYNNFIEDIKPYLQEIVKNTISNTSPILPFTEERATEETFKKRFDLPQR